MAIEVIQAATEVALARALNGMITSKRELTLYGRDSRPNPSTVPGEDLYKHPVNGLTLIFTSPAMTITFASDLDWKGILAAIAVGNPDVAHMLKVNPNGGSSLALWNDTTPVVLSHLGTANSFFGFSTTPASPDLTQQVVAPEDIISINPDPLSKQWVCFYTGA